MLYIKYHNQSYLTPTLFLHIVILLWKPAFEEN